MRKSNSKGIPKIYVYEFTEKALEGLIKIGYTRREDVEERVIEQFGIRGKMVPVPYRILHYEDAISEDGEEFDDNDVMLQLKVMGMTGIRNISGNVTEVYNINLSVVIEAISNIKKYGPNSSSLPKLIINLPDEYIGVPLNTPMKTELYNKLNILNDRGEVSKWPTIKRMLEEEGYVIIDGKKAIIDGKRQTVSVIEPMKSTELTK